MELGLYTFIIVMFFNRLVKLFYECNKLFDWLIESLYLRNNLNNYICGNGFLSLPNKAEKCPLQMGATDITALLNIIRTHRILAIEDTLSVLTAQQHGLLV